MSKFHCLAQLTAAALDGKRAGDLSGGIDRERSRLWRMERLDGIQTYQIRINATINWTGQDLG